MSAKIAAASKCYFLPQREPNLWVLPPPLGRFLPKAQAGNQARRHCIERLSGKPATKLGAEAKLYSKFRVALVLYIPKCISLMGTSRWKVSCPSLGGISCFE